MEKIRYAFGSFVLDVSEHRLWRDGQEIKILPQQFDLLVMFIQNPDHLFTYDEILDLKWADVYIDQSSMQKAVGVLSRLLGDSRKHRRYIHTAHRQGYRWVCPVDEIRNLDTCSAGVKELVQVAEFVASPQFDAQDRLEQIAVVLGVMDMRLQRLESLVLQSISVTHSGRDPVIDILPEDERADVFFKLAQTASPKLIGAEQNVWLATLDAQHDNLRATLDYYQSKNAGRALEMAVLLGRFWDIRGRWTEGREAMEQALALQDPGGTELKAKALTWLGHFGLLRGDYSEGRRRLSESITISRMVEDKTSLAISLELLGCIAHWEGKYREARRFLTESLKVSDMDWLNVWALRALGRIAEAETDYVAAQDWHRKALSMGERAQDTQAIAVTLNNLGLVTDHLGDSSNARALIDKSLALSHEDGYREGIAISLFSLAIAEEAIGRHRGARDFYRKSMVLSKENGCKRQVAQCLEGIAKMTAVLGDEKEAARIFGAADTLRRLMSAPLSPADQESYGWIRDSLRKRFPAQWKEGGRQSPDEVTT